MIKREQKRCCFCSLFLIAVFFLFSWIPVKAQVCKSLVSGDDIPVYTKLSEAMKEPDQVLKLRLSKCKLKEIPSEVWRLTRLQELDLSGNRLEVIPDEMAILKKLKVLKMDNNRIHTISDSLGTLSKLQVLQLGRNSICSLPFSLVNLDSLVCLDLWKNEVGKLPQGMESLKRNLKTIDLRLNPISTEYLKELEVTLPETQILITRKCACNGD